MHTLYRYSLGCKLTLTNVMSRDFLDYKNELEKTVIAMHCNLKAARLATVVLGFSYASYNAPSLPQPPVDSARFPLRYGLNGVYHVTFDLECL